MPCLDVVLMGGPCEFRKIASTPETLAVPAILSVIYS